MTPTLYAAAEAAYACEDGLRQARELGLTELPCTLAGWRAARDAGLDGDYLAWLVRLLPVEDLPELAGADIAYVRQAVAQRPACPPAALAALAEDPDRLVRAAVARHPDCPAAALAALAEDPDWRVRAAVAGHPGCPAAALAVLAKDPDHYVRRIVALARMAP